jgi:hypothetical protein
MIVDCGERMLRMLQIAQRRLQVLSDPRARLLSHTDAAALVNCPDNRRAGREESPGMAAPFFPQCVSSVSPLASGSSHASVGPAGVPCPFWSPATVIAASSSSSQSISLSRSPHNSSRSPQGRGNLPPGLNRPGRIAAVLERVGVTLGGARRLSAVRTTLCDVGHRTPIGTARP